MRAFFFAAALALTPVAAHAQAPDNMTRVENAAAIVEQSTFNRLLPLFGDMYWRFTPQRFTANMNSSTYIIQGGRITPPEGPVAAYASAGLNANMRRLSNYALVNCRRLTPEQKAFLVAFERTRFDGLIAQYGARAAGISTALGAPLQPLTGVTLASAPDCARTASAGGTEVAVSGDLLLTALFSALYVDQQYIIVPDRVFSGIQAAMQGQSGDWNNKRGRRVLERLRTSPAWQNTLRGMRIMYGMESMSLEAFERDQIYGVYARNNPECRNKRDMCRTLNTLALTLTSALKVDMLFGEQVDFVLAHELGHHALGHVSVPMGDCAAEKKFEADADLFAVALMRPSDGLFTQPTLAPQLSGARAFFDGRFKSGLDLFMVQSHRLAALTDGNSCAYPTFEERLTAARAFEKRVFPGS